MDRRSFLTSTGAIGLSSTLATTFTPTLALAQAQTRPLNYYNFSAFSGNFATAGKYSEMGGRLAIKDFGNKLGRPIEYHKIDTEGNPAVTARKVQQVMEQEKARLFSGGSLSSEVLAIMGDVQKGGGVIFTYVGADEVTGKDCNAATFRWTLPTYGAVNTVLRPLIEQNPKWKRVYTITGQYVFGEALLRNTKDVLTEKKLEHVGNSYHSLAEKEYSGYLGNAMASNADVLVILNFGANTLDLLRQAAAFGLKSRMEVVVVWFSGLDTFQALGADLTEGMYFGLQYWHDLVSPFNASFLKSYRAQYNETPRWWAAAEYQTSTLLFDGVRRAGSDEAPALIKALEGHKYQGLTGDEEIRAFDHQCVKNHLLVRGKKKSAMKNADDYCDVLSVSRAAISRSASDCKLT